MQWMLFPMPSNVDKVWETVARATVRGDLGIAAKVATDAGEGDRVGRPISVYTKDFSDVEDVKRVLLEMKQLGLVKETRSIYYKCGLSTILETYITLAYG